jgi:hypothetical protein
MQLYAAVFRRFALAHIGALADQDCAHRLALRHACSMPPRTGIATTRTFPRSPGHTSRECALGRDLEWHRLEMTPR